jgi:radical SAM/Cys-rich protein
MHATLPLLEKTTFPAIDRRRLDTLQVNLGYKCNQSCVHCHVNAGPTRTEMMSREVADEVLAFLRAARLPKLDITGGAPELNAHFRHLVISARSLGIHVMDRCNLTILEQPGQDDLARFLAANRVEVIGSMPCYLEDNVDRQRGDGVFQSSISALRKLNGEGYGKSGTGLTLNLVYNPQGASLPPNQVKLELDYKQHLADNYGVVFDHLYTLANMPIQRFGSWLLSKGQFGTYMQLLKSSHREQNLDGVMCRTLLSVDWQGYVYDCDFNQMLDLAFAHGGRERPRLSDLMDAEIEGRPIRVAGHCYGCTAGQGSSCGGALKEAAE